MNKLTTSLLRLGALLFLVIGFTGTAWAQTFYAAPSGTGLAPCTDPLDPCNLALAAEQARLSAADATILVRLSNTGATSTFQEDLVGNSRLAAGGIVTFTFDTYTLPGPVTGVQGIVAVNGDIIIGVDDILAIAENLTLNLGGQPGRLEFRGNSSVVGPGMLLFGAAAGSHRIQLGDPALDCSTAPPPQSAFIENMTVDKPGGLVEVFDGCPTDDESDLFITNYLNVDAGSLDMNDNNLWITGPSNSGIDGAVNIDGTIQGSGTFFVAIDPVAIGGAPNVVCTSNLVGTTPDPNFNCAFQISGDGDLNMAFDKITDAGVEMELGKVGTGATSYNRAGSLFVTEASEVDGTFRNEGAARTEFWVLETISTNLEVDGVIAPVAEVDPTGTIFTNGTCETGSAAVGNESGVYFFAPVTVEGNMITTETDDPATVGCVEGVWFMGDAAPGANKVADHQPHSTIEGDFSSDGAVGLYLDAIAGTGNFVHNVAFQGDFAFDESPIFVLVSPADAFPVGDLCVAYTNESDGNKVLFTGDDDQNLLYNTTLAIQSVLVKKDASNDDVEIDETSAAFLIDTTLEVFVGNFVTNGLLDANAGTTPPEGATVVISRNDEGDGILDRGDADRAYISDDPEHTPRKVKYTGNIRHFTGDEVPGPSSGSVGGDEIFLAEIEVFMEDPNAVITTGKDFTLTDQITLTSGILDVGSSRITLENLLLGAIGDGYVAGPEQIGARGELVFPTDDSQLGAAFVPSADGIDLLYFGTMDRTVGLLFPPAETDPVVNPARKEDEDVIRDVTIDPDCAHDIVISLRDDDIRYRINRNLIIGGDGPGQDTAGGSDAGTLDIVATTLEISAANGVDSVVEVHNGSDLTDSTDPYLAASPRAVEMSDAVSLALAEYRRTRTAEAKAGLDVSVAALRAEIASLSKAADHAGLLAFVGGDDTDVWVETSIGRLNFFFPAMEVDRGEGHVTYDAEGVLSTTTGTVAANNPDRLWTSHFTLIDADLDPGADGSGDDAPGAAGVELLGGLDIFEVGGQYDQFDGEFLMSGISSVGPAPVKPYVQTVKTGFSIEPGNMDIYNGEFFTTGGDVENFGDFNLGENVAADPGDALFSLATNGEHTVVGDFTVGLDTDPAERADGAYNILNRNRYYLGGECGVLPDMGGLFLNGNYWFDGTGDRSDDDSWLPQQQGLHGNVFFTGAVEQTIFHRQDEDAFFCDVVMASRSDDNEGALLLSNGWQNDEGTLTLEHGIIDTDDEQYDWIILNPGFETGLGTRNNAARGTGVVQLGSRDSYINGEVDRTVESGNATGGVITGGYLFPVGIQGEPRDDGVPGNRDVDFFRPLILQFPDDLGRSSLARVNYIGAGGDAGENIPATVETLYPEDAEWPDEGLVVDDIGGTLTLDVISNQFWKLEFDRIPSFDPNVRVEADELPNIFDIKRLRLIQWDCDGTNPRLAGLYDLDVGEVDDASAVVNDFINSVPNLTQEGIDVNDCNIIGIASNFLINPINLPELPSGLARVQVVHNSPDAGAVDLYIDDILYKDDMVFQSATPFVPVPGGVHKVDIVAGADTDNSSPVFTANVTVTNDVNYVVVAHGLVNPGADQPAFDLIVVDNVRVEGTSNDTEFFIVHGAPDLGPVDIRLLDPVNNNTVVGLLANNIDFDDVGTYLNLAPGGYNVEVTNADNTVQYEVFRFELQSYSGQTFVLNLSGLGKANADGFTMMGVETDGSVFFPDVITADEEEAELPTEFTLRGNYPNPFNPSTTIQIDLPQTAEVTVEIIDMLGRNVMTLPAKQMEAGAARSIEVNAINLASGTYLYRVIAQSATDTIVKTGRMMLIK